MIYVAIYLIGAIAIAARLGWHTKYKLDDYDWHFARKDIIGTLISHSLLWPLSLINPVELARQLRTPARIFEQTENALQLSYSHARKQRGWDALQANLPKCGRYIRHHHYLSITEKMGSLVTIEASLAESVEWARLEEWFAPPEEPRSYHQPASYPQYYQAVLTRDYDALDERNGAFLRWLANRDDTLTEPTDIPALMDGFEYQAEELARRGQASVFCLECQRTVAPAELTIHDDQGKRGWNFNRTRCGQGHTVLKTKGMHLYFG